MTNDQEPAGPPGIEGPPQPGRDIAEIVGWALVGLGALLLLRRIIAAGSPWIALFSFQELGILIVGTIILATRSRGSASSKKAAKTAAGIFVALAVIGLLIAALMIYLLFTADWSTF